MRHQPPSEQRGPAPLVDVLAAIEEARSARSTELSLSGRRIIELPDDIGQLTNLQSLSLESNQLTSLPDAIGQLANLQRLTLDGNQLTSLPDSIAQLTNLQTLTLDGNQLTVLPASLAHLAKLQHLSLDRNPLNPALESVYGQGLPALQVYLRSLEDADLAEPLYEAKLMLVGEGNVGKTTLLKALSGGDPQEGERTTHGVSIDIHAMHLPHPDHAGIEMQLNAWDFGGQEVYRVTHQFFFSRRSIYLLVWEPRMGVLQGQVEDWLKLIRLRVGTDARVIIVSTHAKTGERIARIDKPVFLRDYGEMIVDFIEVDSLQDDPETGEKNGLAELKALIARAARDLEQMGMPINVHWRAARDELLALGQTRPRIGYAEFAAVCRRHSLEPTESQTLAGLMHDLGYIVYYGADERLRDDVVLQPEWLTKAIGFVLEDRSIQEREGILPDTHLREIWLDHHYENEPRYPPELYPFFLRLMERYDVSYRLEEGTASLVAQHVPQVRPKLPWLPQDEPRHGMRRLVMVCVMDDAPPGLVPWMIVRTRDYAYHEGQHRLHWQKGMFLRNKHHGEAQLELRGRDLHISVEAVWSEYFMNVLRQILSVLIENNWPGIQGRYSFAVPCQQTQNGNACEGRFDINAVRQFLDEGDTASGASPAARVKIFSPSSMALRKNSPASSWRVSNIGWRQASTPCNASSAI